MSDIRNHIELETLGVMRQVKVPAELAWLRECEKAFILEMYWAGEDGLHKSRVAKLEKANPDMEFNVTVRSLAEWLTDKAGRPVALTLTWQGEDVARLLHQIAKNESHKAAHPSRNTVSQAKS